MKKFIKDTKFKLESAVVALGTLFITDPVFAATDPQAKLVQAGNTIKGVLTALIVVVGGISCEKMLLNTCRLLMTHKKKIPCIKPWEQLCLLRH